MTAAVLFQNAEISLQKSSLEEAQHMADDGYRRFATADPAWAGKFRILQMRVLLDQGEYLSVMKMIQNSPPQIFSTCESNVRMHLLAAVADFNLPPPMFDDTEANMHAAEQPCAVADPLLAADVASRRGQVLDEGASSVADLRRALAIARAQKDAFREANALLDLSYEMLQEEHYDDSTAWCQAALGIATDRGYKFVEERAEGNLGQDFFKLGDLEQSARFFRKAEETARSFKAFTDEIYWSNQLGIVQEATGQYASAKQAYRTALKTSQERGDLDEASAALDELAFLSVRTASWDEAESFSQSALQLAQQDRDPSLEAEALMAQGLVASHRRQFPAAEQLLRKVLVHPHVTQQSLLWEAHAALADVYASHQKLPAAEAEYRSALDTAAKARCTIKQNELRLSFQTTSSSVYDRYLDYLAQRGESAQALEVADESRALTLAEGMGVEGNKCLAAEDKFNARRLAARTKSAILVYWLGAQHSYLWAIDANRVKLYPLPPAAEIESAVAAWQQSLVGPWDVLRTRDKHGEYLYRTLVAPAADFFHKDGRVVVVADGVLSGLGFDSLIAPGNESEDGPRAHPHYWIDDVAVENASSMRLLAGALPQRPSPDVERHRKLLLLGNPLPVPQFPALPHAAEEVARVESSFPAADRKVYELGSATSENYLASHPEQFAYIDFVAHGSASLTDPLDSAVVLSPPAVSQSASAAAPDTAYKLYARDIMTHPVHADLVTISACSSAGRRIYKGEGLVGLSWAFLGAGAHNVIGTLWDISDDASPQLMSVLYSELAKGSAPDAALRAAKLSLLHSNGILQKPIYWAAFQLYTRS